jgi:hypothetical protein
MATRYNKTLADYLVIAISPALIMTLVGSLVFFLLEVFYQGNFTARLYYFLTLFIFAAVLISRIAIEEGQERATLFGLPLAAAILTAISRFVQFHGSLESLSFVINSGLIALIWWCAHKLTWDCTMIDESEPSSGEGLLDAAGLGRGAKSAAAGDVQTDPARDAGGLQPGLARHGNHRRDRRSKPHAPGVWIVYFSLAALPLFGLGQLAIPAADAPRRRYAFCLLAVYVASGLGLLVTTSLLGLRRYLRQRQLPMPMYMANIWIALGCALIFLVMGLALFVPRPSAEYAISKLPAVMGSPDQKPSKHGMGRDGVKGNQGRPVLDKNKGKVAADGGDARQPGETPPDKPAGEKTSGNKSGSDKSGSDKPGSDKSGSDKSGSDKSGSDKSGSDKSGSDKSGSDKSDGDKPSKDKPAESGPSNEKARQQPRGDTKEPSSSGGPKSESPPRQPPAQGSKNDRTHDTQNQGTKSDPIQQPPESNDADSGTSTAENRAENDTPELTPPAATEVAPRFDSLLPFLQLLFYAVVIGIAVFWAWRQRAKILAALRGMLAELRLLWERLFGGRKKASKAATAGASGPPPPRSFADFADPFSTGMAERVPADQLVQYIFAAVEAWALEGGFPREPEQTPHEFAGSIGQRAESLRLSTLRLADLYCEAAYAPGRLQLASRRPLEELWRGLLLNSLS